MSAAPTCAASTFLAWRYEAASKNRLCTGSQSLASTSSLDERGPILRLYLPGLEVWTNQISASNRRLCTETLIRTASLDERGPTCAASTCLAWRCGRCKQNLTCNLALKSWLDERGTNLRLYLPGLQVSTL